MAIYKALLSAFLLTIKLVHKRMHVRKDAYKIKCILFCITVTVITVMCFPVMKENRSGPKKKKKKKEASLPLSKIKKSFILSSNYIFSIAL